MTHNMSALGRHEMMRQKFHLGSVDSEQSKSAQALKGRQGIFEEKNNEH